MLRSPTTVKTGNPGRKPSITKLFIQEELIISEIKLLANRENGKLGGVKTEAGKEVSKLNAVNHGLLTKGAVIRGEDPELLKQLRYNLFRELEPNGEVETLLVGQIATCLGRSSRTINAESAKLRYE